MGIFKKYKKRMIVAGVAIILLIMIIVTTTSKNKSSGINNFVGKIVTPVQGFFYETGQSIANTFGSIANFSQMKQENVRLKKEVARLEEENRVMSDVISRMDALKNEYELKQKKEYDYIDARVVNKDPGNWFNRFNINKGSQDGVKKGDAVICGVRLEDGVVEAGLIGRVVEVQNEWSKVISIIDRGSNVSFKVIRTGDNGIVSGALKQNLDGMLFDAESEVVIGDKLISSGMGEIFASGLYIGEITQVHKDSEDLVKRIEVKSVSDFKNMNNVMVITSKKTRGQ